MSRGLRCVLTHTLRIHAHHTLRALRGRRAPEPLREEVCDEVNRVVITLSARTVAEGPTDRVPGRVLSAPGQLVWGVLAEGPLLGKQIAARLGWEYSSKLKFLLSDMEERGVLTHDEARGYARASGGEG